jgi:clan AA aspartic protease
LITGSVTPDGGEAVIALHLSSPSEADRSIEVQAVIVTGFTDWIALPPDVVRYLELPLRGSADVMIADGSVEELRIYRVGLVWLGRPLSARAYEAPGGPLVGIAMLRGSRLGIDVVPGGSVIVEDLS